MKYYVVGDTGGHLNVLKAGLESVNVDTVNYVIPEDVIVIHLGDLIHKGASSSLVSLRFVQRMQKHNPGRWIQLVGNHELQHLEGGITFWNCDCEPVVDTILNSMFKVGDIQTSYAVSGMDTVSNLSLSARGAFTPTSKDWLFTHGGLTRFWWERVHNSETDVINLSESINELPVRLLNSPGVRLGYPRNPPSPVWASAPDEVFPSWVDIGMVFNQMAGHTYMFDWERGRWFRKLPRRLHKLTKLNPELRLSLTMLGDSILVGADPGFEKAAPSVTEQPVIFLGEKTQQ